MDKDGVLKNNEVGGESLSNTEKIVAELGDFVKKAKEQGDYEEWREYNVPVELTDEVAPVLKGLEKTAIDYSFDETDSKYIDDLDDFLGVDVDEEDFYDFDAGHVNDDAYSDAKHTSRLQKINALGEDEHFGGYGFAEGFNLFNVKYNVDGGEGKSDETLTYTRDVLGDRKSVPTSMTTGLAELLIEKLKEEGTGVEALAKMPSFEEHMAEKEKSREAEESYEDVAIHGITENLGIDESRLKNAISKGEDDGVLGEAAAKVREKFNKEFVDSDYESMNNKEYFVLSVLSDIHNKWCENNESTFFDSEQSNNRYKFLDFNMIGFEDAITYLRFATPILEKIGIKVNDENLQEQYDDYPSYIGNDYSDSRVDDYYYTAGDDGSVSIGCNFAEKLFDNPSDYLSRGASEKINEAIRKDFDLAAEITMQFGEHRASEEADYGSLWAYHERGKEGVDDYWLGSYDPFDNSEMENNPYFTSQEYINDGWD